MTASASIEEDGCHLNSQKAYIGLPRGRILSGRRFSGRNLVRLYPLQLEQAQLSRFVNRGWLVFLLRDWFHVGKIWLWFHGQSVFLSLAHFSLLAVFTGPNCVSLGLVSGSRCVSLSLVSGAKCFFHWLWFQGQGGFIYLFFFWLAILPYTSSS